MSQGCPLNTGFPFLAKQVVTGSAVKVYIVRIARWNWTSQPLDKMWQLIQRLTSPVWIHHSRLLLTRTDNLTILQSRSVVTEQIILGPILFQVAKTTWQSGEYPHFDTVWSPLWKILATPLVFEVHLTLNSKTCLGWNLIHRQLHKNTNWKWPINGLTMCDENKNNQGLIKYKKCENFALILIYYW